MAAIFTSNNLKKITAIVTAVIGLVVIILGAVLMKDTGGYHTSSESVHYSADYYNTDDASFGADFYTYMYDASNTIVDELNDINFAMATVVDAQDAIITNTAANVRATANLVETVGKVGGTVTIAIGLAILACAIHSAAVAFAPEEKVIAPQEQ